MIERGCAGKPQSLIAVDVGFVEVEGHLDGCRDKTSFVSVYADVTVN